MTFTLDTSGEVCISLNPPVAWCPDACNVYLWDRDLSPFTQGYIEALFASDLNLGGNRTDEPLCAFSDLAPETLARIIADCEEACAKYPDHQRRSQSDSRGAGAGFWEGRNAGAPDAYTRDGFPPLTVQLDVSGKVVFA